MERKTNLREPLRNDDEIEEPKTPISNYSTPEAKKHSSPEPKKYSSPEPQYSTPEPKKQQQEDDEEEVEEEEEIEVEEEEIEEEEKKNTPQQTFSQSESKKENTDPKNTYAVMDNKEFGDHSMNNIPSSSINPPIPNNPNTPSLLTNNNNNNNNNHKPNEEPKLRINKYKNSGDDTPNKSPSLIPHDSNNRALKENEIWFELFGTNSIEFIQWTDLLEKTKPSSEYQAIVYKEGGEPFFNMDEDSLEILRPYIGYRETSISRTNFIRLFSWFSPIKVRTSSKESQPCWKLEYLLETLQLDYFFGFEDSASLDQKLTREPAGTFLVRFSSRTPGGYAIMAKHGSVVSWKIDPNPGCFLTMPCSNHGSYVSIKDVVEIHQNDPMPKIQITLKIPFSKTKKEPPKQASKYKN